MNQNLQIVLADAEVDFRETVAKILRDKGDIVTVVGDAGRLFATLERGAFDVMMLDLQLPDLGSEGFAAIRSQWPAMPVILLTSIGDEARARWFWTEGAFDYLCKPCGVDILVSRIHDAFRIGLHGRSAEKSVAEIMIPVEHYTTIQASCTVREGIERLKIASESFFSSGLIMDSGHRAILVFDHDDLVGVLTMRNLIQSIRPGYMDDRDCEADHALRFSHLFWKGLFTLQVGRLADMRVGDIMNPRPPVVPATANLAHVAHLLCMENRRRVAVEHDGRIVGVVREQELFHELSRQMLGTDLSRGAR